MSHTVSSTMSFPLSSALEAAGTVWTGVVGPEPCARLSRCIDAGSPKEEVAAAVPSVEHTFRMSM